MRRRLAREPWFESVDVHRELPAALGVEAREREAACAVALGSIYLADEHGGWENDDGAYGTFTFNIAARTIAMEFNGRFTDVFASTHEF